MPKPHLRRTSRIAALFLLLVHRDLRPFEFLAVGSEAEAVKKVSTSDQRHVPKAWDRVGIRFDRHIRNQSLQKPERLLVVLFPQMLPQLVERGKGNRRTNE